MSKKTSNLRRNTLFGVAAFLAAIILAALGGFIYYRVTNHRLAAHIDSEYGHIHLPSTLQLQHRQFSSTEFLGGPGTYVGWTYTYKPTTPQSMREINDSLRSSLQTAGFTVPKPGNGFSPDAYGNVGFLSADSSRLQLMIIINAVADSNNPNAKTDDVSIDAYEE